jgi:hypothetical protein
LKEDVPCRHSSGAPTCGIAFSKLRFGLLECSPRILEIGGGYGALAYWFKQAFPRASYSIVDLPECILFSRLYLSLTIADMPTSFGLSPAMHGIRFIPNFMAEQLKD